MESITERNLANLAKNQKVPYIIVFDGDPSSGAAVYFFEQYLKPSGSSFLIVYTKRRAVAFTKDCNTQIGTFKKRYVYWPERYSRTLQKTPPTNPNDVLVKGKIHGKLLTYVSCSYHILNAEKPNEKPSFTTLQMEESPNYFKLRFDNSAPDCIIELFFEISAALDTYHENATLEFNDNKPGNPMFCVETTSDEWYPEPQRLHKLTCFDNPFGPFTNFTIHLHHN